MKRAKYTLRPLMVSVEVKSLANGWLRVEPRWREAFNEKPGVQTRLAAAMRLEDLINSYLRSHAKRKAK